MRHNDGIVTPQTNRLLQTGCSVVPDDYIRAELNRSPLLTDFLESFSALRRKVYDHRRKSEVLSVSGLVDSRTR
uniref:Uncharacterized protein n=1 Tax=Brassica oleracea TaxID=3712 RepID=A0A3P6FGD2_BRAOL|nr:unnamed protein product [Brassica oleracea]